MSLAWKIQTQTKIPARPQLVRISDSFGVESVRQLKSDPAAVDVSDNLKSKLPVIGHRFVTPSVRYNSIIKHETPAVRIPLAITLITVSIFTFCGNDL